MSLRSAGLSEFDKKVKTQDRTIVLLSRAPLNTEAPSNLSVHHLIVSHSNKVLAYLSINQEKKSKNMGLSLSKLFEGFFGKQECRILMVGLDAAGKVSLLSYLEHYLVWVYD